MTFENPINESVRLTPSVNSPRVLLVDEDADRCDQLARKLATVGLQSTRCSSPAHVAEQLSGRAAVAVVVCLGDVSEESQRRFIAELHHEATSPESLPRCIFVQPDGRNSVGEAGWLVAAGEGERCGEIDPLLCRIHHATYASFVETHSELESWYRRLMDASSDAIVISDATSSRILDANLKAIELTGCSLNRLRDMRVSEVFAPDERTEFMRLSGDPNATRRGLVSEFTVENRLRRRIPVEVRCWRDSHLGRSLLMTVFSDITVRKRSEQALRMTDERFRQLTENIDEVFWLIDWNSLSVLYVSPAYESVWGRTPESAVADSDGLFCRVHAEHVARVKDAFMRLAPLGRFEEEFRIVRPSGEERWVHVRAFPIHSSAGELYRIAAIANDVTDHRGIQEELRRRNDELAHLSRLSTMGELVAELAHEINQPLYAISNFADACSNVLRSRPAEMHEYVRQWTEQISVQAKRAGEIIRRISRFLRKDPPSPTRASLNEIVHGMLDLMSVELRAKSITLHWEPDDDMPPIYVTPLHIEQLLVNLLRNAVDAVTPRPIEQRVITVGTRVLPGTYVEVFVSDTGVGIEADQARHVFDPFFTTKPNGLGLGLAICQSTLKLYGGDMTFDSEVGVGTTFRFTLPAGVRSDFQETAARQKFNTHDKRSL